MVEKDKIVTEAGREKEGTMSRQKNNRRWFRLAVWGLLFLLSGCKGPEPEIIEEGSKAGERAVLTICIAQAQWDESIDGLTALYLKSHPEVESIQWTLVQRNIYSFMTLISVLWKH